MNPEKQMNLTMLCDYYELTMTNGYYACGMQNRITYFDIFFRSVPDGGGFAIAAGLEQAIRYIQQLHFDEDDIAYLRGRKMFSEGFLESLRNYKFTGDIWAVPEGTPIFPNEPIMTVRAPAIEAQIIETFLLLTLNHQSLIATKANRVTRAAQGRTVLEFGSRRAQGSDAAVLGARAAYIGGCKGTACTLTDELYGVPAGGTMAHSWVQMFDSEYEAFKAYCEIYPDNPTLLVDTYNVLKSGVPNAIRVFNEVLKPRGLTKCGVRLDSGDMTYLTKKTRKMLDEAGNIIPKIKVSENVGKITNPHFKKVYRFYGNDTGKAIADYICLHDEVVDDSRDLEIFDPQATWKRKNIYNFTAKELLVPIFQNGELVYNMPSLPDIQKYCAAQVDTLWDEVQRFDNPHTYYVDLSQKLWDIKYALLKSNGR